MNTFIESNKGKHFTLSDRISIEAGIEKGWSFKKIADESQEPFLCFRGSSTPSDLFPPTITMTAAAGKPSTFIFLPAPNRRLR